MLSLLILMAFSTNIAFTVRMIKKRSGDVSTSAFNASFNAISASNTANASASEEIVFVDAETGMLVDEGVTVEAASGESASSGWGNDRMNLKNLDHWRSTASMLMRGSAITGLGFRWTGTCQGYCHHDGPVLRQMSTLSQYMSDDTLGDYGEAHMHVDSAIHHGGWRDVRCPGKRYMTGMQVNTAGTCQGRCNPDGPVIRRVILFCSSPRTVSSNSWQPVEKVLQIANRYWTSTRADCPAGYFVNGLQVDSGGSCDSKCEADGDMVRAFKLWCSPSKCIKSFFCENYQRQTR